MKNQAIRKSMRTLIKWGVIIGFLHIIVIILYGLIDSPASADIMMVLGSKVEETGEPAKRLQYRLNKGLELYQAGRAKAIIVSGGIGKEGFDEAAVMADYLIQRGVPDSAIIRDNTGINTYASAKTCKRIMEERGAYTVLVVSQYFHLLRAKIACSRMGIPEVRTVSSDWFFEWRDAYSIPREVVGLYYYVFRRYEKRT